MAPSMAARVDSSVNNRFLEDIKCGSCNKIVRNGIICDGCDLWHHFDKCSDIKQGNKVEGDWYCKKCNLCSDKNGDVGIGGKENCVQQESSSSKQLKILHEELDSLKEVIKILREDLKLERQQRQQIQPSDPGEDVWTRAPRVTRNHQATGKETENGNSVIPLRNYFTPLRDPGNKRSTQEHTRRASLEAEKKFKKDSESRSKNRPTRNLCTYMQASTNKNSRPVELTKLAPTAAYEKGSKKGSVNSSKVRSTRVLVLGDSHARGIAENINNSSQNIQAIGYTKPGAPQHEILRSIKEDPTSVDNCDVVVIIGGANDAARDMGEEAIQHLSENLGALRSKKVVVSTIPHRVLRRRLDSNEQQSI